MESPTAMGWLPSNERNRFDTFTQQKKQLCCFLIRPDNKEIIPMSSLEYKVDIQLGVAVIGITQTYNNTLEKPTDLEYLFSIPSNAAFTKMEVQFGDKLLVGLIKEKEEAKKEFQQGVEDGKTMVYSEQDDQFPDVMRVKLGNLAPQSSLKVLFQYTQPLEVCVNEFWKLTISSIVNPRYCLPQSGRMTKYIEKFVNLKTSPTNYKQDIQVNINLPTALTFCRSPTHDVLNLAVKDNQRQIILNPEIQSNYDADKTFVLLFANEQIHEPQITLTHVNNDALAHQKYCATISFIPKFNPLTLDDAYQAYLNESDLETQEFKYQQIGEYIFLIDRSGSMEGQRILKAKEALGLFLRSLPNDSYFNVYSFGNSFSKLWDQPQKYSKDTLNQALTQIENMSADMGGTELLQPVNNILNQVRHNGYPYNLFILTDGEVSPDPIVNVVKLNCKPDIRVYTLGIGSGCSRFLIEKVAWAGNGKCHFIDDNEDLNTKVIDLLQDSITPYLEQFQLNTTIQNVHCITPNPKSLVCLRKNNPCTIQVLFGEQAQDIQQINLGIQCYDPQTQQSLGKNIILNMLDSREEPSFHKLAALQQIQAIEEAFKYKEQQLTRIDIRKNKIEYQDLVSLSSTNQVLSRSTAFICEVADLNDQLKQELKNNKIIIKQQQQQYQNRMDLYQMNSFQNLSYHQPVMCSSSKHYQLPIAKSSIQMQIMPNFIGGSFGSSSRNQPATMPIIDLIQLAPPMPRLRMAPPPQMAPPLSMAPPPQIVIPPRMAPSPQMAPPPQQLASCPPPPPPPAMNCNFQASNIPSNSLFEVQKQSMKMQMDLEIEDSADNDNDEDENENDDKRIQVVQEKCKSKESTTSQPAIVIRSYLDILNFAEADGSFNIKLANSFQVTPNNYNGNIKLEHWICILAMCYLEIKFDNDRNAWNMIFKKCLRYLQDNQIEYKDHKDQAKVALHI